MIDLPEITDLELCTMRDRFNERIMLIYNNQCKYKCKEWREREWIQNVIKTIECYQNESGKNPEPCPSPICKVPLVVNKYQIKTKNGEKVLRMQKKYNAKVYTLQLVAIEDFFNAVHDAHLNTGHGDTQNINKYLRSLQLYIPTRAIECYKRLCEVCQSKCRQYVPVVDKEICHKGFFEIVSMTENPDEEYEYILHYRDLATDSSYLRPLRTTSTTEVSMVLLNLFLLIGCPGILSSVFKKPVLRAIIEKLNFTWPECIVLTGTISTPSKYHQIHTGVKKWMSNGARNWSLGIYFVANQINFRRNKMRHVGQLSSFENRQSINSGKGQNLPPKSKNIKYEDGLTNFNYIDNAAYKSVHDSMNKSIEEAINLPGPSNIQRDDSTKKCFETKKAIKTYTKKPKKETQNQEAVKNNLIETKSEKIDYKSNSLPIEHIEMAESVDTSKSNNKKSLCVDENIKENSAYFQQQLSARKRKYQQSWNTAKFDLPPTITKDECGNDDNNSLTANEEKIDIDVDFGTITELQTEFIETDNDCASEKAGITEEHT